MNEPNKESQLEIIKIDSQIFAENLPKDKVHFLEGVDKYGDHCYFGWFNGQMQAKIYDLDFINNLRSQAKQEERAECLRVVEGVERV